MPDHGGGTEGQPEARILQSPTNIDVVARSAKTRIKPADRFQRLLAKGHVTSRQVFRLDVVDQNVDRTAGRVGHAVGDHAVVRRLEVRSAHPGPALVAEGMGKVFQPIAIGPGIVVDVGHDFSTGCGQAEIPRGGKPAVRRGHDATVKFARDLRRAVGRTVVDHNHFLVGVIQIR